MKFYFRGVIWDKDANKALCIADDGVFETEDEKTISKLEKLGIPSKVEKKKKPKLSSELQRRKKPPVIIPEGVTLKGKK